MSNLKPLLSIVLFASACTGVIGGDDDLGEIDSQVCVPYQLNLGNGAYISHDDATRIASDSCGRMYPSGYCSIEGMNCDASGNCSWNECHFELNPDFASCGVAEDCQSGQCGCYQSSTAICVPRGLPVETCYDPSEQKKPDFSSCGAPGECRSGQCGCYQSATSICVPEGLPTETCFDPNTPPPPPPAERRSGSVMGLAFNLGDDQTSRITAANSADASALSSQGCGAMANDGSGLGGFTSCSLDPLYRTYDSCSRDAQGWWSCTAHWIGVYCSAPDGICLPPI